MEIEDKEEAIRFIEMFRQLNDDEQNEVLEYVEKLESGC